MNMTVRREWYEAAEQISDDRQRAAFYDMLARYFFDGEEPNAGADGASESACVLFAVVRHEIDRDRRAKEIRSQRASGRRPAAARAAAKPKVCGRRPSERFVKPTAVEVAAFCKENGYDVDAERFVSHYESNGWRVGKVAMRDWKAAVRGWVMRRFDERGGGKSGLLWGAEGEVPDGYAELV